MTHIEPHPEGQTRFEQRFLYFAIEQAVSPYFLDVLGCSIFRLSETSSAQT
jgi:hypothetical protein